jgi:hypothetical protein
MSVFNTENIKLQTGPLQNLFIDIKKIIEYMEVKNKPLADAYETEESKAFADLWIIAIEKKDSYITYAKWWTKNMFLEIDNSIRTIDFQSYVANPYTVPLKFREKLLEEGRKAFLTSYYERNPYYRMINGFPALDDIDYIYLSEELQKKYGIDEYTPVQEMPDNIQNLYMNTDEYQEVLTNNPDKGYLKYMGSKRIDIYTARKAKDFDIIRYPDYNFSINSVLLDNFAELYADYREYVMVVLYNNQLDDIYTGYRDFMGFLIISFALMQIGNRAIGESNRHRFLDDTTIYTLLSMYKIPSSLIVTNDTRRSLANQICKLIKEKGTDDVYYDLIQILGYQDVVINKLMLMRGDKFNDDGSVAMVQFIYDHKSGDLTFYGPDESTYTLELSEDGELLLTVDDNDSPEIEDWYFIVDNNNNLNVIMPNSSINREVNPYFLALDILDTNPYETIANGKAKVYSYEEITQADPTWWDTEEVQTILKSREYTIADSKYITIESTIHQMEYLFESIYFSRMVIDNKLLISEYTMDISSLFDTPVSIYDCVLGLICATCLSNGLDGTIYTEAEKLISISGFNFELDMELFDEFLETTSYVDKTRLKTYLTNLAIEEVSDISRVMNNVLYPLREWLEDKIVQSINREEYIEYESIYRALFTYDGNRNKILDDFEMPIKIIRNKYNISESDMQAFKHFYPRTIDGNAYTVNEFNVYNNSSRYHYPFISLSNKINWYIHIIIDTPQGTDDRGYLYFHDVLNSNDIREITNSMGDRIFMDYEDSENGWQINTKAVNQALSLIDALPDDELKNASFQVYTPILNANGPYYDIGEKLPSSIRNTGVYKDILRDKIQMDINGLSEQATTYFELLKRSDENVYNLIVGNDLFNTDKELWLNNISNITTAIESELNLHMKYYEESIIGKDLYYKPLITLIKRFKSSLVEIIKTDIKFIFDSKMDMGGNSNMFKLFDNIFSTLHEIDIFGSGYESQFGFFDIPHSVKHKTILKDRSELIRMIIGEGFAAQHRESRMGSIRMVDEMKFYKNGKEIDPTNHTSMWYNGEPGSGRYSDDEEVIFRTRIGTEKVNLKIDMEGWKDYVESYNWNE